MCCNDKYALLDEIAKTSRFFINEFDVINNEQNDALYGGTDKTPTQLLSYQIGWLK